ncbi:CS1 type fimbrial major subunit [Escherichia coli]|uniref:CS1 type fimbrial major subunit n=1 Tax=Escherichia coli TaxID=562 RepID=UPI002DB9ED47|nr:CS1 type fimbrial major subunit [Escherichia coli]
MKKLTLIAGLLAVTGGLSTMAHAVDKVITVTASIDPTLDLVQADDSPLPSTVILPYTPVNGLGGKTIQTRLYSNAQKDVTMSLTMDPVLTNVTDPTKQIPLKVKYNGQDVTTAPWVADKAIKHTVFVDGRSPAMPLTIYADNKDKATWTTGNYQGAINMVIAATTTAP